MCASSQLPGRGRYRCGSRHHRRRLAPTTSSHGLLQRPRPIWHVHVLAMLVNASRRTAKSSSASESVDGGVDGAIEADDGIKTETPRRFGAQLDQLLANRPTRQASRVQLEDRCPNVANRGVQIVDGSDQPLLDRRVGRSSRSVACRPRPMAKSRWMTVSCRSRAMRSRSSIVANSATRAWRRAFSMAMPAADARPTASSSSTSVKASPSGLVAQVQVAEHLAANGDRHAQERRHLRMIRREAESVRMVA